MVADLGDDVHPLRHMIHTEATIFRPLVMHQQAAPEAEQFTDLEIVAGRFGALTHDIGECEHPSLPALCGAETPGDIPFGDETEEDKAAEAAIRRYFMESLFSDVPDDIKELAEDTVANDKGTLLRVGFDMCECIGYLQTGIQAGRVAMNILEAGDETEEQRFYQLQRLALRVAHIHFDYIDEHGSAFAYTRAKREELGPEVEAIHATLSDQ